TAEHGPALRHGDPHLRHADGARRARAGLPRSRGLRRRRLVLRMELADRPGAHARRRRPHLLHPNDHLPAAGRAGHARVQGDAAVPEVMPNTKKSKAPPDGPAREGYRIRTQLIHGKSKTPKWDYSHHVIPPISSSATFRLSSSQRGAKGFFDFACDAVDTKRSVPIYIYDRLDEPTRGMLEDSLAVAEGGDVALCFATGMAAITPATTAVVTSGDEVLAHQTLYGCTYSFLTNWLPRQGASARFADFRRPETLSKAIRPETRVVYFESPVTPTMELIDIAAIRKAV